MQQLYNFLKNIFIFHYNTNLYSLQIIKIKLSKVICTIGAVSSSTIMRYLSSGHTKQPFVYKQRAVLCFAYCFAMWTRCAIAGMVCPCIDEVGDINAPVAQKATFLSSPALIFCRIYEQSTDAEQPQPEPPE